MSDNWRPAAEIAALQQRAQLLHTLRHFFARRQVMEVNTPVIVRHGVSDPHLDNFSLSNAAGYLRTSPEYAMKRLLSASSGDIYELGPVFREGEAGRWHNPEFWMLEWYRSGWSYQRLIDEVIELLQTCSPNKLALWPVTKISYVQLSQQVLNIDITSMDKVNLLGLARSHGWHAHSDDTTRSILLDFLFSHLLQTALPAKSMTIIYDFPACQAALAKIQADANGQQVAQRFEVFLEQTELANGYQELTDANEQLDRFIDDQRVRQQLSKPAIEHDQKLLAALRQGMPECAGVALGVDRLLAVISEQQELAGSMAFDWHRR